jgi:Fungal specific transcription factor domain
MRYSTDSQLSQTGVREQYASQARQIIVFETLDRSSLEGLQALIILAIHTLGIGQGPRSWSIVGMVTRLASQLGIGLDTDSTAPQPSTLRVKLLPQSTTWSEAEERRRTFWAAFILDRFASVGTGWNTSYNILDIDQKLPCDDKYWDYSQQVEAPKFSRVDKSNSSLSEFPNLSFPDAALESFFLGSFAYLVEAVECLSRVHTFFLQKSIDTNSPNEVQMWVSRCRLLDTMLLQWKDRLPERFKFDISMKEPNLVLMWATYNAYVLVPSKLMLARWFYYTNRSHILNTSFQVGSLRYLKPFVQNDVWKQRRK